MLRPIKPSIINRRGLDQFDRRLLRVPRQDNNAAYKYERQKDRGMTKEEASEMRSSGLALHREMLVTGRGLICHGTPSLVSPPAGFRDSFPAGEVPSRTHCGSYRFTD